MNAHAKLEIGHSVCPHDCPSTCALDVELLGDSRIGRVHGAKDNTYTAGVICAKVARYAERIHHPDRLLHPLRRTGPKGSGQFERISLGRRARPDGGGHAGGRAASTAPRRSGPTTMPARWASSCATASTGCATPSAIRGMYATICTTPAWTGYIAGTGKLAGPDPREMAKSDLRRDLGHQPGQHAGQRDDARDRAPARSAAPRSSRSTSTRTAPCSRPTWRCACGPAPTARSPAR